MKGNFRLKMKKLIEIPVIFIKLIIFYCLKEYIYIAIYLYINYLYIYKLLFILNIYITFIFFRT